MKKLAREYILQALPATQYGICEKCGVSNSTASRVVRELLREGRAHISGWNCSGRTNGPRQAVYSPGPGEGKKKPRAPEDGRRRAAPPPAPKERDPLTKAFFTKAPS